MNIYKKTILISALFLIFCSNANSDIPHYVDFKYILNQSQAGKQAQDYLQKKLTNGIKGLKSKEKSITEANRIKLKN